MQPRLTILIAITGLAAHTAAQVSTPPARLPELPGTDDAPVFTPTAPPAANPADPGLTRGIPWDDPGAGPAMLAEGTFITARRGRVLPGPAGMWIFSPARDERLPGERPMLLVPSLLLEQVAATVNTAAQLDCEVSGRVLSYHNRNYLELSSFRPYLAAAPVPVTAPASEPSSDDAPSDPAPAQPTEPPAEQASTAQDPEIEALIAELTAERSSQPRPVTTPQRPARPQVQRDRGATQAQQDAATQLSSREGELLVRRRGRVVRGQGGAWMFTIDNDTQATGAAFTLVPSRLLEQIERVAQVEGEIRALTISGRVTTFEGDRYLQPTSFRIENRDGVNPLQ